MSDLLLGSICLSDIPKELITTGKNGKKYLSIAVSERREEGQYGDTHNIIVSKPKDQRADGEKPIYIGNLKRWVNPQLGAVSKPSTTKKVEVEPEDLPF